jgi:5-methylcytosine-specific restriction endonuclease McrBC regulatory subunit McrC
MWVDKCAKANRYGLPRKNVRREHQGVTLKGSLDIRRTIMPWLTQKEICTNSYEKVFDDTICKIVYEAHRILSQDVIGKKQDKKVISISFFMPPMVQDTIDALNTQYKGTRFDVTDVDYKRIRYNNIYMTWKPLVDFSWDVIRNRKLGYRSAETQGECIFVDMAEIWEAFLRKKLGEGFADGGWRVLSVEECTYKIYQGKFFERPIIPDIILTRTNDKGESEYMVFDAKYKRMRINSRITVTM